MEISIVILTKNAGRKFKKVLASVFDQKIDKTVEVVIIDSGSKDKTLKIAKKFSAKRGSASGGKIAKILEIQPHEFDFGKTKNLAITLCQGKYIVFLSQDALPQNEWWLKNLIQPLEQKVGVAGVYSRQIPYKRTNLFQQYALSFLYPEKETNIILGNVFFSNVSSVIKKEVFEQIKFPENIPMSEDQAWAKMAVNAGYKIFYAPDSVVFHSHNYSFWKNFKRNFDSGLSLKKLGLTDRRNFWQGGLKYIWGEIIFLFWKRNIFFVLYIPDLIIYEGFRVLGFWLGVHYQWLPISWRKRCSLFKKNLE
ncbi:MAG: glycosyltransferase family 2 protein [Bacteroidetes bacterium]|nr:glycosyltransferase family 2 protein [Bacteroidota bacterium]